MGWSQPPAWIQMRGSGERSEAGPNLLHGYRGGDQVRGEGWSKPPIWIHRRRSGEMAVVGPSLVPGYRRGDQARG